MPLFSDRPGLERMMQQRPMRQGAPEPPALPPEHPCFGCAYGIGPPCIGYCCKALLAERSEKE